VALGERATALEAKGVEVIETSSLDILLAIFAARGISSLLVEGGATVARAFLDAGLVDRIMLFAGPTIVGEGGLESPMTPSDIPQEFTLVGSAPFGRDRAYEYERSA
jgi:diaminohydroxyphosphoribosylaminopyrimidine deaminase/5-amino-6-(5-phosphoribosylamino)uracil reductase